MIAAKKHCVLSWTAVVLLTLAASLLGCASGDPDAEGLGTASATLNGPVALAAQSSGMCLDISGTSAIQATCSGSTSQQWTFNPVSGGSQIVSVFDSTRCLNVPGGSTTKGTLLAVTACSTGGVAGEIWTTVTVGADFNVVATQSQQCMDVYKASTTSGAAIDQYTCTNQKN